MRYSRGAHKTSHRILHGISFDIPWDFIEYFIVFLKISPMDPYVKLTPTATCSTGSCGGEFLNNLLRVRVCMHTTQNTWEDSGHALTVRMYGFNQSPSPCASSWAKLGHWTAWPSDWDSGQPDQLTGPWAGCLTGQLRTPPQLETFRKKKRRFHEKVDSNL